MLLALSVEYEDNYKSGKASCEIRALLRGTTGMIHREAVSVVYCSCP